MMLLKCPKKEGIENRTMFSRFRNKEGMKSKVAAAPMGAGNILYLLFGHN
jgi:hypothetical protein